MRAKSRARVACAVLWLGANGDEQAQEDSGPVYARGAIIGFTKVTRDLTEQKRVGDALRRLNEGLERRVHERTRDLEQALKARDEFLSIASHELKTPLTSLELQIQMALRNLERGTATPERDAARHCIVAGPAIPSP